MNVWLIYLLLVRTIYSSSAYITVYNHAVLCDSHSWLNVRDFCKTKRSWFKQYIDLNKGLPSPWISTVYFTGSYSDRDFSALLSFERALILKRQHESIILAKARGAYKGRKRKLTDEIGALIDEGLLAGMKKTDIARSLNLTRQSIYVHLKQKQMIL